MYSYIKGLLMQMTPLYVIVEAGGIGYKLWTPVHLFSRLPQIGQEVFLSVSLVVREQSQTLYGFLIEQERDLFELLQGVSGIGPKLSLSLIGHLSLQQLQEAIVQHELSALCRVPGIGKKMAERLVIELRDKLKFLSPHDEFENSLTPSIDSQAQKIRDAMSALINLGYNQMTAQKAIKKILEHEEESLELPELISAALKCM